MQVDEKKDDMDEIPSIGSVIYGRLGFRNCYLPNQIVSAPGSSASGPHLRFSVPTPLWQNRSKKVQKHAQLHHHEGEGVGR
jgi:hypothetical protein